MPTQKDYFQWIGKVVRKKSNKPFKSGLKLATVVGIGINEHIGKEAFTFKEDNSMVNCDICRLVDDE